MLPLFDDVHLLVQGELALVVDQGIIADATTQLQLSTLS